MFQYRKDRLTIDDLIAVLVALKTTDMPPPPHLELPQPLATAMTRFLVEDTETEISGEVSIDEDGNAVGTVKFTCRC